MTQEQYYLHFARWSAVQPYRSFATVSEEFEAYHQWMIQRGYYKETV